MDLSHRGLVDPARAVPGLRRPAVRRPPLSGDARHEDAGAPREISRGAPALVVVVGLQGSGKSTWVRHHLAATAAVVSKDHWPNARRREARQQRVVRELLTSGRHVVVDNTNPSPAERAPLLALAHELGAAAHAVFVDTPLEVCLTRNAAREGRAAVPLVGVFATRSRLVPPSTQEGFASVHVVRTD